MLWFTCYFHNLPFTIALNNPEFSDSCSFFQFTDEGRETSMFSCQSIRLIHKLQNIPKFLGLTALPDIDLPDFFKTA